MLAQAPQLVKQVDRGSVSLARFLGEAPLDEPPQRRRRRPRERRRVVLDDGGHGLGRTVALEGAPAGGHFIQDQPEGKLVGAKIGWFAPRLLGRHVPHRAQDGPANGGLPVPRPLTPGPQLSQSEVEDLDSLLAGDHDVLRLEVAVGDAGLVGGGHPIGHLNRQIEQSPYRQRATGQQRPQGQAVHQLGDEVGYAVLGSDVVNGEDVGVVEGGDSSSFLLKAPLPFGVLHRRRGQDLDRHFAPQPGVAGAVDLAHTAGAELLQHRVVPQGLTRHWS